MNRRERILSLHRIDRVPPAECEGICANCGMKGQHGRPEDCIETLGQVCDDLAQALRDLWQAVVNYKVAHQEGNEEHKHLDQKNLALNCKMNTARAALAKAEVKP